MKVEYAYVGELTTYSDLPKDQAFRMVVNDAWDDDKRIFIKTEVIYKKAPLMDNKYTEYNAFCLNDCRFYYFTPNEHVKSLKTKVVVG